MYYVYRYYNVILIQTYGDGVRLALTGVTNSDAGVYRCIGSDDRGRTFYDDFNLEVESSMYCSILKNRKFLRLFTPSRKNTFTEINNLPKILQNVDTLKS